MPSPFPAPYEDALCEFCEEHAPVTSKAGMALCGACETHVTRCERCGGVLRTRDGFVVDDVTTFRFDGLFCEACAYGTRDEDFGGY